MSYHRSLKFNSYITSIIKPQNQKRTVSLHNDIMRFSVLGFRSDIGIELRAPVVILNYCNKRYMQNKLQLENKSSEIGE